MLLSEHTFNFQSLDHFVEFAKKMDLATTTGDVDVEINGDPILTLAAELGDEALVTTLLDLGAKVNNYRKNKYAYGNTALIEASRYGHLKIVKLLISKGADLNNTNFMGNTALMYATLNRHTEVVKYLLHKGAKVDIPDNNNDTPLLIACAKGYQEIVEMLLEYGANIFHVDNDKEDAFIMANNYQIIKLLHKYSKVK